MAWWPRTRQRAWQQRKRDRHCCITCGNKVKPYLMPRFRDGVIVTHPHKCERCRTKVNRQWAARQRLLRKNESIT